MLAACVFGGWAALVIAAKVFGDGRTTTIHTRVRGLTARPVVVTEKPSVASSTAGLVFRGVRGTFRVAYRLVAGLLGVAMVAVLVK